MANFVSTDCGLINLDHVRRIWPSNHGGSRYNVLFNGEGQSLDCFIDVNTEQLVGTLVPVPSYMEALVFYIYHEGSPKEEDIFFEREPIVAWRIDGDCVEPVFLQSITSGRPFLKMSNGRFRELKYDSCQYDDIEEIKKEILRTAFDDIEEIKRKVPRPAQEEYHKLKSQ